MLQKTVIRFYIITFDYYLSLCYYLLPNMESKRVCGKGDAQRCSTKKVFLKLFVKFTGKHRQRSLFLMKLHACNLTKKRLRNRCFPVHFEKKLLFSITRLDKFFCELTLIFKGMAVSNSCQTIKKCHLQI